MELTKEQATQLREAIEEIVSKSVEDVQKARDEEITELREELQKAIGRVDELSTKLEEQVEAHDATREALGAALDQVGQITKYTGADEGSRQSVAGQESPVAKAAEKKEVTKEEIDAQLAKAIVSTLPREYGGSGARVTIN